ncbi:MAG: Crp/Fnr family transcriptional regulator [Sediminibacterium magnilacihabitans]|jgi:CRP-like cAMP-binding protein|nr:Crp/Fnr family transcriptional regulator [Sediminibacterium magnilacihabitans]PQV62054.1 CRP-like cAMP-binding protein [Sediminibacterium magnilacihabitans]
MYSQVINYIKQRVEISREEIEESLQYSDFKKYAKGDYILRAGEYCRFIGFLNKGFIVTTFVDETGSEKASEFKHEGCFFTYTEGLTNNSPSHKNFIAIEDCEALVLNKEDLPLIFKANPKFETLFSLILAEELRLVLLNEQNRKTQSAEERYLALENTFPQALQRIPVKYMAGYLGIEAPSLSRLRRRLAGK